MNLVEFAEKTSSIPLSDYQKKVLEMYDNAQKEGKYLFVCYPPRAGRGMIINMIEQFKKNNPAIPCNSKEGQF